MSETRKCLAVTTQTGRMLTACGNATPYPDEWRGFQIPLASVTWLFTDWIDLPRAVQCDDCFTFAVEDPMFRAEIEHVGRASASLHHILAVSLFCGAIAGVLDSTLSKLLADYCAGDDDSLLVLLDLAETRGMHEPGYKWPAREPREWQRIERHEHVWLEHWRAGIDGVEELSAHRRCTCGVYEHEHRRVTHTTGPWSDAELAMINVFD